jgi:hypothetical protein
MGETKEKKRKEKRKLYNMCLSYICHNNHVPTIQATIKIKENILFIYSISINLNVIYFARTDFL